jgi:hypothetical protein
MVPVLIPRSQIPDVPHLETGFPGRTEYRQVQLRSTVPCGIDDVMVVNLQWPLWPCSSHQSLSKLVLSVEAACPSNYVSDDQPEP